MRSKGAQWQVVTGKVLMVFKGTARGWLVARGTRYNFLTTRRPNCLVCAISSPVSPGRAQLVRAPYIMVICF